MKSTISSTGQITVPAAVREKLRLAPGTAVQFELTEGGGLMRCSPAIAASIGAVSAFA